ncbi:MAG: hypothetical protein HKN85_07955 [Gammaproteobacteria bacterium]|nr:hypothetical protein [Gammaproteobacteria bacterium]
MLLGTSNKLSYKALEQQCAELRELVEKQQGELNENQRHIVHLTENARRWSKKFLYDAAKVAVKKSRTKEYHSIQRMQDLIVRLEAENEVLQRRMSKMQALLDKVETSENEMPIKNLPAERSHPESVPTESTNSEPAETAEAVEIRFSNQAQMTMAKYAKQA